MLDLTCLEKLEGDARYAMVVRALRRNPKNVDFWEDLLDMAETVEDEELELACYRNLMVLEPDDYTVWFNAGIILRDRGEGDRGEEYFRKTTEIKPGFADAWVDLARITFLKGSLEEGLEYIEKAIAANPKLDLSYINAGYYLVMMGQAEKGLEYSERGIKYDKYACTFNKAHALLALGRKEEALEYYVKSLKAADSQKDFTDDFEADFKLFDKYKIAKKDYEALLAEVLKQH